MTSQREGQLRRLAESYTAAWCSQNAARVAGFYSLDGSRRGQCLSLPVLFHSTTSDVTTSLTTGLPDPFLPPGIKREQLIDHVDRKIPANPPS